MSNVDEREDKDAARCSKSRKPIATSTPAFVHVKGAPGMREIARRACRRERIGRSALHDGGGGRVARRQLHRAPPQPGDRVFESIALHQRVCLSWYFIFLDQEPLLSSRVCRPALVARSAESRN